MNDYSEFSGLYMDDGLIFNFRLKNLSKTLSSACYAVIVTANKLKYAAARAVYVFLIDSQLCYALGCEELIMLLLYKV